MKQNLDHNWKMKCCKTRAWSKAVVPGTVYTDLLRNRQIEDPFWKDNEDRVCSLMKEDYEYECRFFVQQELKSLETILLHFDGLDTAADIYLNESWLGHAENMHRIWEYDVTHRLADGENVLKVRFGSPLQLIANAYKTYGTIGNEDTYEGFMHLRKAHCMFGWDWGAHLPDAGIFRPVSLIGICKARIDSIRLLQRHEADSVILRADLQINSAQAPFASYRVEEGGGEFGYSISITAPDGSITQYSHSPREVVIQEPRLWWPSGLGSQPLYKVRVSLEKEGTCLDIWERSIGLRTLTMRREKDQWGESFAHEINGETIFAMGADYIPEDHLLGRTSREKTRQLLENCKEANFNTVRVWGGGYYPEDWFYELCDEMGLMVWQDFMFACSVYELTPEFEANIRQEFVDNIKRIRHHASLALWCGNNEMEMFVEERCWVTKATEVRDYLFMYERLIPEVLKKYDPNTFYWPASPSSGGSFDAPNDPNRGDVHYWEVWHGNKPFTEYRRHFFRYASEFGFQSFPAVKTLETVTDQKEDLNPFSYVMEKHQRNYGANGKIMNYLQQMYLYPGTFSLFVYASQLLQGEAIRYGVEHFRRNRGRCMGAIYWQLNDCWPVISWSSIDYHGRWKALHYYAKRFFAPLMISCEEQGMMSAEANMNRQHFEFEKSIRLNVANETREEKQVTVKWALRDAGANITQSGELQLTVPPLSAVWLKKQEFAELDIFKEYISFQLLEQEQEVSSGTAIFSYPKYFRYQNPRLSFVLEGDEIVVAASAYAKSVEIQNEQEDLLLTDNYFDMNAGEKRVRILRGEPKDILIKSVYDIR